MIRLIPQIEVSVNATAAIEAAIEKRVDEVFTSKYWFVDSKRIAELSCLSLRFLEEHVFSDPRMRAIMIQKNRKRLWRSEKALEVMEEIFSEW